MTGLTYTEATDRVLAKVSNTEIARRMGDPAFVDELLEQTRELMQGSQVADLWNSTSVDDREKILLAVLTGSERKVSAFALAVKQYSALPDYVRQLLSKFAKPRS